jgi:phytoene desaturase
MSRVVVIGAGLAGLSAAAHLVRAGYEVSVVERGLAPGGLAGQISCEGFTFDTGPCVLTMPDLLAQTFDAAGARMSEALTLTRLDPAYRACFADGSTLRVYADRARMRAQIAAHCGPRDAAAFDAFVDWLQRLYHAEMPNFIDRNYDSAVDLTRPLAAVAALLKLGAFGRLGRRLRRQFDDDRLRRLFGFQALYAGLSPQAALSIYAVITYMDTIDGVWFPTGGIHAVPRALAAALSTAGVRIRCHSPVRTIEGHQRATGVCLTTGEWLPADAIVCTLDRASAYRLLPQLPMPRRLARARYSPSAVVWHVGMDGALGTDGPSAPAHHNIHFGHAWESAFDQLIRRGTLMQDPSRLVTVPSLTDPSLAPPGSTTLYVLEPVPNLYSKLDWRQQAEPMRDRLYAFLRQHGYPSQIHTERMVTPLDWQRQGLTAGSPFSLAHTFAQTGPFRPANAEPRLPGLFFAGASTVPGVGIPMVLISGRLAARRVSDYLAGQGAR